MFATNNIRKLSVESEKVEPLSVSNVVDTIIEYVNDRGAWTAVIWSKASRGEGEANAVVKPAKYHLVQLYPTNLSAAEWEAIEGMKYNGEPNNEQQPANNAGNPPVNNAAQQPANNAAMGGNNGAAGNAVQGANNAGLAGVGNAAAAPNLGQLPNNGAGHGANQLAGNGNNAQPPHGANLNNGGNDNNGGGDNVKDEH
ncbi:hypothetical protein FOL47_010154 [Perkinsus chesapeaki]|uniref:Uncharacterized protein n=1 Tax=Perkinsus chesapeaki TaxID=330153 RepID=A0A7J6L483_PERCH|nr:hypothetical protein FOL47_010154 [Perkinsus chesapeaki]